jgi:peptidoglycan lytic transglycosylase B
MVSPTFRHAAIRAGLVPAIGRQLALALALVLATTAVQPALADTADFAAWLKGLRAEAIARGISPGTVSQALAHLAPLPRVIELDRKQPEFTLDFATYIERRVSPARVQAGRELAVRYRALLARIAALYGVQPRFVLALWGMESDFGRATGDFPVVAALATLAYDGRRSSFFRGELIAALRILAGGYIDLPTMKGSWAGAMGQTQFMPSSYLRYAVDYYGSGHRDIWHNTADVLASIANYLARVGWRGNETWGRRVRLPPGFDRRFVDLAVQKPLHSWAALGVCAADGAALPTSPIEASIMEPAGAGGPAYAVYGNYRAILKWNRSFFFATAVGLLADRVGDR